jgi:hypothetical protein
VSEKRADGGDRDSRQGGQCDRGRSHSVGRWISIEQQRQELRLGFFGLSATTAAGEL